MIKTIVPKMDKVSDAFHLISQAQTVLVNFC